MNGRGRHAKRYSPKFKLQVVLELLTGEKTAAQVAKAYGIHPNSASYWRRTFLEKGAEIFAQDGTIAQYEQRIAELERLLGKREVEITLLEDSWDGQDHDGAEGGPGGIGLGDLRVGTGPGRGSVA